MKGFDIVLVAMQLLVCAVMPAFGEDPTNIIVDVVKTSGQECLGAFTASPSVVRASMQPSSMSVFTFARVPSSSFASNTHASAGADTVPALPGGHIAMEFGSFSKFERLTLQQDDLGLGLVKRTISRGMIITPARQSPRKPKKQEKVERRKKERKSQPYPPFPTRRVMTEVALTAGQLGAHMVGAQHVALPAINTFARFASATVLHTAVRNMMLGKTSRRVLKRAKKCIGKACTMLASPWKVVDRTKARQVRAFIDGNAVVPLIRPLQPGNVIALHANGRGTRGSTGVQPVKLTKRSIADPPWILSSPRFVKRGGEKEVIFRLQQTNSRHQTKTYKALRKLVQIARLTRKPPTIGMEELKRTAAGMGVTLAAHSALAAAGYTRPNPSPPFVAGVLGLHAAAASVYMSRTVHKAVASGLRQVRSLHRVHVSKDQE